MTSTSALNSIAILILPLALCSPLAAQCARPDFAGHLAPTRIGPRDVAAADVDGDSDIDLAVANYTGTTGEGDQLSILLNDGLGNFTESQAINIPGNGCQAVALGDLDNDGDIDAVVGEENWDSIVVLRNNGVGFFGDITEHGHQLVPTWPIPNDVALGDLDGNGYLDIVSSGMHLSVMLNFDGNLAPERAYGELFSYGVAVGDVDGDGDLDVLVAEWPGLAEGNLMVWKNDGIGSLAAPELYPAGITPSSVDVADIDGDGDLDAVVANWFSGFVEDTYVISILTNDGSGAFVMSGEYEAGERCRTARFSDISGDGVWDVTVSNNVGDDVSLLLGYGDGTFGTQQTFPAGDGNWGHAAADFDGDGSLDIATANYLANDSTILMNLCDDSPACVADIDGNAVVDGADLGSLVGAWGACSDCGADLDGSGTVDGADLGTLLGGWGPCSQ